MCCRQDDEAVEPFYGWPGNDRRATGIEDIGRIDRNERLSELAVTQILAMDDQSGPS